MRHHITGRSVRHVGLLAAALTLPTVALTSCTTSHAAANCILGAHPPPGRPDVCVADVVPVSTRQALLGAARTAARENHGTVTRAVAVESTRAVATHEATGATVTGAGFIWVVEVAGHFQCGTDCFGSPVARAPQGTDLVVLLDTYSFKPVGFHLGRTWVDLSHLGPITVLQR